MSDAIPLPDSVRFAYGRMAMKRLLNAFQYTYTKCAMCGDERMAMDSLVDQEMDHAVAGCNGPLYQFDPTRELGEP